tara:strand:- start:6521 stop:6661 length:141 start_codon:yes stop_codon:yes gene_type:complete
MTEKNDNKGSNEKEGRDHLKWSFIVLIILVFILIILIQINFPDIAE